MDFKKKFDHEDLSNYLPDNWTLGRSEFYQHKFNDKMPLYVIYQKLIQEKNLMMIMKIWN